MKVEKKPLSTKQKIREQRKKERGIGVAVTVAIMVTVILVSGFVINFIQNHPSAGQTISSTSTSEPKAAIVDQLTMEFPNETFTEEATNILEQAGYAIDYYSADRVTVDFFRGLPSYGYKIILLRVHVGHNPEKQDLGFFTSELYSSSKYVYEQLNDLLERVAFRPPTNGEPTYFAINPLFVESSMTGRFNDTTIIAMGCYGLEYPCMAAAFIDKGAKVYVGWNGLVSATHTDQATLALLKRLLLEKQTIRQAAENTMDEVGPDPYSKSLLRWATAPDETG